MTKKYIPEMTQPEAIEWIEKNCSFADVRKRLRSRAASWIVLTMLKASVVHIAKLERTIKILEEEIKNEPK